MKNLPEVLEALGVASRRPDLSLLGQLFEAFNRRILFESASKIVRNEEEIPVFEKPRTPEIFWREYLDLGAGGTCFARTAGFRELLRSLGFESEAILATILTPESHASLLVSVEGEKWLVDVGYPLSEILPMAPREIEGLTGEGMFEPSQDRATISFVTGPEAGRRIEFDLKACSPGDFRDAWTRTFKVPSLFLKDVVLRLQEESRVLRFFRGELHILDAQTRTILPAASMSAGRLSEIFGIDAGLLGQALSLRGEFEPPGESVRIEAYLDDARAPELFSRLALPEGYRRFISGLGSATVVSAGDRRFRVELTAGNGASTVEEVEVAPDRRGLSIHRREGLSETGFRLEETPAGPRVVRYAVLEGRREEMLRSDLARARISAILSMDLLALSRLSEL